MRLEVALRATPKAFFFLTHVAEPQTVPFRLTVRASRKAENIPLWGSRRTQGKMLVTFTYKGSVHRAHSGLGSLQ